MEVVAAAVSDVMPPSVNPRGRGFESRSCRHAEMRNLVFNVLLFVGRVAEWLMASVLKTEAPSGCRGSESPSFL